MNKEDATQIIADLFQELSKKGVLIHSVHGDWIDVSNLGEGKKWLLTNVRIDVGIHRGWADEAD